MTPLAPARDVAATAAFYRDVLGFEIGLLVDGYAFLRRDAVAVRLVSAPPEGPSESACYIDVDDVDALYAELKPKLDALPEGRVRPPFDQDYGQREFHVRDPDSMLIFFGAPAAAAGDGKS